MRIIDLLNKIANGEEVPEKVVDITREIIIESTEEYDLYDKLYEEDIYINDEVEILEEEKEIPEKLEEFDIQGLEVSGYSMTQAEYLLEDGIKENREMINWILDYLNRKGE